MAELLGVPTRDCAAGGQGVEEGCEGVPRRRG